MAFGSLLEYAHEISEAEKALGSLLEYSHEISEAQVAFGSLLEYATLHDDPGGDNVRIPLAFVKQFIGWAETTLRTASFTMKANRGVYRIDIAAAAGTIIAETPPSPRDGDTFGVYLVSGTPNTVAGGGNKEVFLDIPGAASERIAIAGLATTRFQCATYNNALYVFQYEAVADCWDVVGVNEDANLFLQLTNSSTGLELDRARVYRTAATVALSFTLPFIGRVGNTLIEIFAESGATGALTINRNSAPDDISREGATGNSIVWTPTAADQRLVLRSNAASNRWHVIHDWTQADRF